MKKLLALLLCAALCVGFACPAFAEEAPDESGTLKIVNYNVDGLPIPPAFSTDGRDPLAYSKKIPDALNAYEADIIAVQEDFNFHGIHKRGIDMPYKTLHSGPIPFGDGLNFFAKFSMYNIHREPWIDGYGILDSSADRLTPKGFLCVSMEIADGVYIDVYDLHADADDGEGDIAARVSEFKQLLRYVNTYSKDHAVIILGDTNARFLQPQSELKKQFIDEEGFKEIWIELENESRYTLTDDDVKKFNDANHNRWWGYWDTVEKLFYRDGGGVSFEAVSTEFEWLMYDKEHELADHAAQISVLGYTIDRSAVQDSRTYKKEHINPLRTAVLYTKYFFKSLFLILSDLPRIIRNKAKAA